ncbi:MAG TPA: EAL domain-containing protein [Gaiellaceae bacterium]|nr:EAL domain-containing protein [Gaiellaceae bacterium]
MFQPIVDLTTGRTAGLEALSRFPPDLPGPEQWFASAEAVGLRRELEAHAAAEALRFLDAIDGSLFLSLNLSPDALRLRPCAHLPKARRRRVVLGLTEHAPVDDYDALCRELDRVRADGVRVAVDDAGAGFANLRHVLRVTPDFIKLDADLTHGIHDDRRRRALEHALVTFADELGATIVAEGIETEEELETLRSLGVGYGQGYYIARPQPLDGLADFLP